MEAVLDVEISWKFDASTMKNRGENEKWKIVEKKKKKEKKETLRKQKGLPMKSEDLNDAICTTQEVVVLSAKRQKKIEITLEFKT